MPKVSVIVPVYNTEKYLEKCLTSLATQTLKDIEIIIVNDGSPDNSDKIISKFTKKHPNFKSYKKENGGLSDARNYGIKKATGDYLGFIDSDDYAEKNMFEALYNKAISNNFDITVCDIYLEEKGAKKVISSLVFNDINKEEIKEQMVNIYPAVWNKLYKKDLFTKDNYFKKGVLFEDVEFFYRLVPYINSIGVVNEPLINYVQREGAITKTFDKRMYHYIDNFNGIIDFYNQKGFYEEYKEELEYVYVRYLYATFIKGCTNFSYKEYKIAVNEAIKNVKTNFPNYKNNKYLTKGLKNIYLKHFNPFIAKIIYLILHKK